MPRPPAPEAGARPPARPAYRRAFMWCLALGVGLRLVLVWVNPPDNYFDNHYEPILWIMQYGSLPPKDALWQAYQPPVFYVVSAAVGSLEKNAGASPATVYKTLQFLAALFGILALWLVYLILKRVPISEGARLAGFAAACFLPQSIYQCALHSNDTTAYLGVALTAWLMLVARERGFPFWTSLLLCATATLTLFTKYTAFVVLPMMAALVLPELARPAAPPRRGRTTILALLLAVPLLVLGAYVLVNLQRYGQALPWNTAIYDPSKAQPHAVHLSFVTFTPWTVIATPILAPSNLGSFWTLIHGRMWFDMEPKFLFFLGQDPAWWTQYYAWLRGEQAFPGTIPWSAFTHFTGSTLVALGLVPLALLWTGLWRSFRSGFYVAADADGKPRWTGMQIFPALLLSNAAGVLYLTLRSPVFSSVKAIYFLVSLPAFAVFIGLGIEALERHRLARALVVAALAALFALVTIHIAHIGLARGLRIAT